MHLTTNLIVYQSKSGSLELKTGAEFATVWLTQDQLASLFSVQKAAISKHLKNIFVSEELKENSVVSKMETTAKDGKTYLVNHYNLDAALSVGYRINSKKAIHFPKTSINPLKTRIFCLKCFHWQKSGGVPYSYDIISFYISYNEEIKYG